MENDGDRPHRPLCRGNTGKRPCYARDDSEYCSNHDPEERERRAAAGRRRNLRFTQVLHDEQGVPHAFDRAKVPTIAHIVDELLLVSQDVRHEHLTPLQGRTMVAALKAAREALFDERAFTVEQREKLDALGGGLPNGRGSDADDELRDDA